MKKYIFIYITLPFQLICQSNDCNTAQPFCTGTNYTFPASTNTTAPLGPDYGCLLTQPNPAFYFLQIDQPGNLTITMQSTPLVDIDFICWGPYSDFNTMCDSLTGAYITDCSYSTAAIEDCDIVNASTGEFYVLLITNFSNVNCNIDFSQTSGSGTTNCCLLGNAGTDNIFTGCNSDPSFLMENQLNGNPAVGGSWYNSNWNPVINTFNPANDASDTYAYIVQGTPVSGSTVSCPNDTAFLSVNINLDPSISFNLLNEVCANEAPITLNTATPAGGLYEGNNVNSGVFTPDNTIIGNNIITYSFTDVNGCSDTATQSITVNEAPIVSLGPDTNIACQSTINITPNITGGNAPYNYFWSDGSNNTNIFSSGGNISLTISDINNCIDADTINITEDATPLIYISGGDTICDDGSTATINFLFNGLLPWNLSYNDGTSSYTVNNINNTNYSIYTSNNGVFNINNANDPNGCEASIIGENISVLVYPVPNPIISPSYYEIYPGEEIVLSTEEYLIYSWHDESDSLISENKNLIVDSSLTTYVIVESPEGCTGISNNANILYIPRVELYIPNTFTPNGDYHNDLFVIKGKQIQTFNMIISNRWGDVIYETNNINKYWDGKYKGKIATQGIYTYQINITGNDQKIFTKIGTVNVLY